MRVGTKRASLLALLACCALGLVLCAAPAQAQEPQGTVLVFPGAIADPTTGRGSTRSRSWRRRATSPSRCSTTPAAITGDALGEASALVFLNTAGDLLDARAGGGGRVLHRGRRRLPGHRQRRPVRARHRVLRRPDRRAARRRTARPPTSRADRRLRRSGPSRHARPRPAAAEPHRRLVRVGRAPDGAGPHARALPRGRRAGGRRHRRRRHRPADLVVPGLRRRPLLLHGHGPHRGRVRRDRVPRAPERRPRLVGRPAARQLQGHDRLLLRGHEDRLGGRGEHRARHERRVARADGRAQRLGALHRPRRLPHRRGARRAPGRRAVRADPRPRRPGRRHRLRQRPRLRPGGERRHAQQRHHARRHARRLRRRRPGR